MSVKFSSEHVTAGLTSPDFFSTPEIRQFSETTVYDQEQDTTFRNRPNWEEITELCRQAGTDTQPIYDYETKILEPIEQIGRESLRQRVKRIMGRAGNFVREASIAVAAVAQAKTEDLYSYYDDSERGAKRQKASAVVAGTLLVGGLVYLEMKGVGGSTIVREVHGAHHGTHHEQIRHVAETTLHKGENPWTITEDQLHAHGLVHPTEARIVADDERLLRFDHISTLQALKLQVGTKLKLLKAW